MMLAFHPLANLFPLIGGDEFAEIVADMRQNGFRDGEQIVLHDGLILDGRNRFRAAVAAGIFEADIDPLHRGITGQSQVLKRWFKMFIPERQGDPLDFVIAKNLRRRHLSASQRGMIAAEAETFRHGGDRKAGDQDANLHLDRSQAAASFQVSERTIADSAKVRDHGVDDLKRAVLDGSVAVSAAADVADLPAEQQQDLLKQLPRDDQGKLTAEAIKQLKPLMREVRDVQQAEKRGAREGRERMLAEKILRAPTQMFGVILEDFEWDQKPYSRETGMDRHPSNHYPTADDAHTPEEIVARTAERFKCAHEDSVLYMWTTIPHAAIAFEVMRLRGYTYKSQRCWDKVRNGDGRGPGYWVTGEHELLLIGTRGKFNAAPIEAHFPSRFEAPVGKHSEKPDQQYEHAEYHFPNLPKIELNARRARPGWVPWGLEAPDTAGNLSADATHGSTASVATPAAACVAAGATPSRIARFADDHGMVRVSKDHVVAAGFVTEDEWQKLEALDDGLDIPAFLRRTDDGVSPIIGIGGPAR